MIGFNANPPDWRKSRSGRGNMHGLGGVGKIRLHKALLEHPKGVEVLAPYDFVDTRLGEDVGSLIVGWTCYKPEYLVVVALVEPRDPLCAGHVSHVWVVTCDDDSAGSLIVLKDADGLWDRSVLFDFALTYD